MTIDQARSLVPARVGMNKVQHSKRGSKREWGYDKGGCAVYVIFGAPGQPISLYVYRDVDPSIADAIRQSSYDSQTITDLLVKPLGPDRCKKLYPTP